MLSTILLTLACATLPGEGVFRDLSLDQALAAAKAENKVVFVDFFTTWCGPCKKLDRTTWVDEKVVAWLGDNTVPIKLDAEAVRAVAGRYRVQAYPTLIFMDAKGVELGRIVGYRDAETFLTEAPDRLKGRTALEEIEEQLVGHEDNVSLRHKRGGERARAGDLEGALSDYLFCFDEGREWPGFVGVRVSFLLNAIVRLGNEHPPALAALRLRVDMAAQRLFAGEGGFEDVQDLSSLNNALGEKGRTLEIYDKLRVTQGVREEVLDAMFDQAFDQLLETKRYREVIDGVGDVLEVHAQAVASFEQMKKHFAGPADEMGGGDMIGYLQRDVVTKGCKYHTALLGVGDDESAAALAEALIAFDPSGTTFGSLASSASQLERFALARALLLRGLETVDEKERASLRKANRRLPKAERAELPRKKKP